MANKNPLVVPVYKKCGETPLECLERHRHLFQPLSDSITYAGRLDPLAEGVMLLLAGSERLDKELYTSLPKEYVFDVLWGVGSDSDDILGVVQSTVTGVRGSMKKENGDWSEFVGLIDQRPPTLSTPGFVKAGGYREAWLNYKAMPAERQVKVMSLDCLGFSTLTSDQVLKAVTDKISLVKGDFRQDEVLQSWQHHLKSQTTPFRLTRFRVRCSAGTYIRSLARDMGQSVGQSALAWQIRRERVGIFSIYNCR